MLEIKNLSSGYGDLQILWDVSLHVGEGELVAIVGPNGAGKTTLMNTLSGMVDYKGGEIRLAGEPIHKLAPQSRVARGLIQCPEGRRLFPEMTVAENLRMGAYLCDSSGEIRKRQEMVEHLFPILRERRDQIASSMSGGQQQMVAIGRALMAKPKVLLLDEPSLGLAPIVVAEMFDAIDRIRNEGMTLMIVEQNVQQTLQVADRAYVLENGAIALEGKGTELLDNPHMKAAYLGTDAEATQ
jgi:branched-chain amino acid transport system ATP-binding protein